MKILMLTNTYLPHVGGVARSVESFSEEYRRQGHEVLIVAPEFPDLPGPEDSVVRVPAIQKFNASDFSVVLPVSGLLTDEVESFQPDIVHSHHPFLLGMTALRVARFHQLPLVFTHHTFYEEYTEYVPGDSPALERFVIELATSYANLADCVFAPSESVAQVLRERGVNSPIVEVPTGVERERFVHGDGGAFRKEAGIPDDAYLVGHLGRLAPEKNLEFLAEAVAEFVGSHSKAHFLVVGAGPSEAVVRERFAADGLSDRLHLAGVLQLPDLADALHAMDVFAFASKSETQGMVMTEAMAAGVPVVALDAPGAREVVRDKMNGRLVMEEDRRAFRRALEEMADLSPEKRQACFEAVRETAIEFSMEATAERALTNYRAAITSKEVPRASPEREGRWQKAMDLVQAEWDILRGLARAGGAAFDSDDDPATDSER